MYRGEVSRADMRIWITLVMGASTDKVWYIFELLVRRTIFPMKIDTEFICRYMVKAFCLCITQIRPTGTVCTSKYRVFKLRLDKINQLFQTENMQKFLLNGTFHHHKGIKIPLI